MAYNYIICQVCGTVQRSKNDLETWTAAQIGNRDEACINKNCSSLSFKAVQGKQDVNRAKVMALAGKMKGFANAHTIPGPVYYDRLREMRKPGEPKYEGATFPSRDIKAALIRLAAGDPLPADVNNRAHGHDGQKYKGGGLPIRDVKHTTTYYTEWGMLSSSRGWEKNLGSERLVTGASGEVYYNSYHYRPDWWWGVQRRAWHVDKVRAKN